MAAVVVAVAVVVLQFPSITGAVAVLGGGASDVAAVSTAWLIYVDCWNVWVSSISWLSTNLLSDGMAGAVVGVVNCRMSLIGAFVEAVAVIVAAAS